MTTNIRMRDLPTPEKPRERLLHLGADAVDNTGLIAILLRTGTKGASVVRVAEELLSRFRTLDALSRATISELRKTKGIGKDKAVALKSAFTLAQRMAREIRQEAPLVDTPEAVANLLREENRLYHVEHFQVVLLNVRHRLIRVVKLSDGTLDTLLVHPRDVFKAAIEANAASVILVHNHPSGDPTPSPADVQVTRDLVRAGQLLKIDVLDHVILGRRSDEKPRDYVSLKEMGLIHS